jgi:hypothetical protein
MTMILDGTNGATFNDGSLQAAAASPFSLKNRIINGDMVIDQRNSGASVTPANGIYTLDRWGANQFSSAGKFSVQQNAGSVTPPAGFTNYLGVTSLSAYSIGSNDIYAMYQIIEGYNIADLAWGTANAKTITLSFWARSSLTGTFGGSLQNDATDTSYPYTYTISSANTWEYKTVTIVGPTTGTWLTNNGLGILLRFSLGAGSTRSATAGSWQAGNFNSATGAVSVVGTNGATLYITGVQLERNTTATPFEWLPYSTELALCQRYFVELYGKTNAYQPLGFGNTYTTTQGSYCIYLPVPMRTVPSLTTNGAIYFQNLGNINISSFAGPYSQCATIVEGDFTMSSAVTVDRTSFMRFNNVNTSTSKFNYSAEL